MNLRVNVPGRTLNHRTLPTPVQRRRGGPGKGKDLWNRTPPQTPTTKCPERSREPWVGNISTERVSEHSTLQDVPLISRGGPSGGRTDRGTRPAATRRDPPYVTRPGRPIESGLWVLPGPARQECSRAGKSRPHLSRSEMPTGPGASIGPVVGQGRVESEGPCPQRRLERGRLVRRKGARVGRSSGTEPTLVVEINRSRAQVRRDTECPSAVRASPCPTGSYVRVLADDAPSPKSYCFGSRNRSRPPVLTGVIPKVFVCSLSRPGGGGPPRVR